MYSYHTSHHARILTLSDVAERGKSIFIISLAPFGAAFLVVPIHVPLDTRHVAGLGPLGGCAAYDYRWLFPSHANGPGWSLATKHSPCYPLDRDTVTTHALTPFARLLLLVALAHSPISYA
jgi:hypothetical protein